MQAEAKKETEYIDPAQGNERALVDLMRDAVDGTGNFMSRLAQKILLEKYQIRVAK